jgi:hypothetical protein
MYCPGLLEYIWLVWPPTRDVSRCPQHIIISHTPPHLTQPNILCHRPYFQTSSDPPQRKYQIINISYHRPFHTSIHIVQIQTAVFHHSYTHSSTSYSTKIPKYQHSTSYTPYFSTAFTSYSSKLPYHPQPYHIRTIFSAPPTTIPYSQPYHTLLHILLTQNINPPQPRHRPFFLQTHPHPTQPQ